jgi:hypothetical protein
MHEINERGMLSVKMILMLTLCLLHYKNFIYVQECGLGQVISVKDTTISITSGDAVVSNFPHKKTRICDW